MTFITQIISEHLKVLEIELKTFMVNKIITGMSALSFSQQDTGFS